MSGDRNLVPVSAAVPVPAKERSLSPALAIQHLTPHRVIDAGPERIFYFIKVGAKAGTSLRRLDPTVARQVAMIVINASARTFKLQWYPHAEKPQIVTELPMNRLPEAVEDLKAAGF